MLNLLKEKLKNLLPAKESLPRLVGAIAIAAVLSVGYFFLGSNMSEVLWIITAVAFSILFLLTFAYSAFFVFKSLIVVAAEISLLIFLAQSYCAVPNRTVSGDDALKVLLVVGLVYITVAFFKSLFKASEKQYKNIKHEKWSFEKTTIVGLILFCAFILLTQIYLVVDPIILNLCVVNG